MVSALANGVIGGKWFSLVDKVIRPTTLDAAWRKVARNKGAAGVDGQSTERFAAQAERYLRELHDDLKDGSYRPNPVKRVEIPKGDGRDAAAGDSDGEGPDRADGIEMVIEPIFEVQFRPGSYGFRPGRSCKDALREVDRLLKEGYTHVVDADLKGYFDSIPHDRLMALVAGSISDGRVLSLIEGFLQQDIMTDMARWQPTTGTPQGAVMSPLLANLYLHPLDLLMEQSGWRMVRYADDFVILCRTEAEARTRCARLRRGWQSQRPDAASGQDAGWRQPTIGAGVRVPRLPVRGGPAARAQEEPEGAQGQGEGANDPQPGRQPRADHRRSQPDASGMVWLLQTCHASVCSGVSTASSAGVCAPSCASRRSVPASDECEADHRRWPNAFFADHGLFTLRTAFESARHSR